MGRRRQRVPRWAPSAPTADFQGARRRGQWGRRGNNWMMSGIPSHPIPSAAIRSPCCSIRCR